MNIYSKLAQARVKLQEKGLSKSGNNRNFKYFELKDFLPEVNKIFSELNMCGVVTFTTEFASLTIHDGEKDEKIIFTSPMVERALPSGTDIQNLGAIETYQRRYLYLSALEIAESDAVDCLDISAPQPSKDSTNSPPQVVRAIPPKSFMEKIKEKLAQCSTKEKLAAKYDEMKPWFKANHPDKLDEFNLLYNDMILNLM